MLCYIFKPSEGLFQLKYQFDVPSAQVLLHTLTLTYIRVWIHTRNSYTVTSLQDWRFSFESRQMQEIFLRFSPQRLWGPLGLRFTGYGNKAAEASG
jgi:hypothetical protein